MANHFLVSNCSIWLIWLETNYIPKPIYQVLVLLTVSSSPFLATFSEKFDRTCKTWNTVDSCNSVSFHCGLSLYSGSKMNNFQSIVIVNYLVMIVNIFDRLNNSLLQESTVLYKTSHKIHLTPFFFSVNLP